jgi:hypothetical protein
MCLWKNVVTLTIFASLYPYYLVTYNTEILLKMALNTINLLKCDIKIYVFFVNNKKKTKKSYEEKYQIYFVSRFNVG